MVRSADVRSVLVAGMVLAAATPGADAQTPGTVEALLHAHHEHRIAHLLGDPERLVASFADPLLDVSRGRIEYWTRPESAARFEAYLAATRFLEWEDVAPPVIRFSGDSTLASVAVEKRVRALVEDADDGVREDAARFVWTGTWQRTELGWQLVGIASSDRPETDSEPVPLVARIEAWEILDAANEAVGGRAAVAAVAMLRFEAEGEGPRGPFTNRVRSARDGRAAFRQSYPDRPSVGLGVDLEGAWLSMGDEEASDSLGPRERAFLRSHEWHLLAIAPEARYRSPRALGRDTVAGHPVRVVRFLDPEEAPTDFFYRDDTGLPLGFRVPAADEAATEVVVLFDDWRAVGNLRLPFRIQVDQGERLFRLRVTAAAIEWMSDDLFGSGAVEGRGR